MLAVLAGVVLAGCTIVIPGGGGGGGKSGGGSSDDGASDDFNQTDVMFAQMMIPHHEQAIAMSEILIDTEGVSDDSIELAEQIAETQQPEIDQLEGLLESWGIDPMSDDGMQGMGGTDGDRMSGMAGMLSAEEIAALDAATGAEAERLFLDGMIEHHEGAIGMAEPVLIEGQNPELIELAGEIVSTQLAEIETMQNLVARL